jgi:hypothetical protein
MHILSSGSILKARGTLLFVILGPLAAGCGSGGVPVPRYDPETMARAAMAEYDKNHDGKLDSSELEACPALKSALPYIAKDKQPYITEEDIAERLREFQQSRIGLLATRCKVTREGAPVPGVTVTFIPEGFMGNTIKSGSGISDTHGNAVIATEGLPGLGLGYYRIEASLKDVGEKETLPPQFNTSTKLGHEIQHKRPVIIPVQLDF